MMRSPLLQECYPSADAPIIIWFMALAINCERVLTESGILGKPSLVGKVELASKNLNLLEKFNEHTLRLKSRTHPLPPSAAELNFRDCPTSYLVAIASDLAANDHDFGTDYWHPYYSTKKRWTRKIRENKHLQAGCLLPNGKLFVTGQGKKIPPSVKGFGCRW